MEKELFDLISQSLRKKELIEDVVVKLESAGVTSKEHFYASTLKVLYSYGLSSFGVNKLRSILTQSVEWYSPEEIVNFLTSGDENVQEVKERLIFVFEEWNNWSLLQGEITSPDSFLENFQEEDRKYGRIMIDTLTDLSKVNEKELDLDTVSNIVSTKIQAFEKRIPVPGDFESLYNKQSQLKELKVKFNKKLEYQNRMNRKDAQSPEPIIQIQLPKANNGNLKAPLNAFQFHQNRLSCFLEDITDEIYSVVVFVGATGAGKSLAIRTGLSSESTHLPISKFGVVGTTSDVCFYLSSREELLGSTKNVSGKDFVVFVDTEGTNALCALNDNQVDDTFENSSDKKMIHKTMKNLKRSIGHLSDDASLALTVDKIEKKEKQAKRKEKKEKEKKEREVKEKEKNEKKGKGKEKEKSPRGKKEKKEKKVKKDKKDKGENGDKGDKEDKGVNVENQEKEKKEKKERKLKSPRKFLKEISKSKQEELRLDLEDDRDLINQDDSSTNSEDRLTEDISENLSARKIEIDSEATKIRNECLKNIFPLAYFISTVIVYTVSSLEVLRREETFNDIKSFSQYIQGKNSVDIIKPSLIILVNRYNTDSDNDLNYIKNLYFEVMENEFTSFSTVQFVGFPQCGLRASNGSINNQKIILDDTEYAKVKRFYETLSNAISNVNENRSNGILQSALTFNQFSYSKLIANVCNALPNPVDLKTFWKEQIFRVMFSGKEKSFPSRKCIKYINSFQDYMTNILKEKIDITFEQIESTIIKLFNYYWILQLMEIKGIGVNNLLEQIEVQDKVQIYQNDLEELRSVFTKVLAPCGFHKLDNGKKIFCSQPQTNHSFHRVKVPMISFLRVQNIYTVKKIEGDFIPICTLESQCDSLMEEARKFVSTIDGNQIFDFGKFFKTYLNVSIPKFIQPPLDWKSKDGKIRKTIINNHKSYFKNGICRICHTNPTEYIFSCELPHSICESCYKHFVDCKNQYPSFPFCPFCDILSESPKDVTVSHIFNFIGNNTETDRYPFRGMDQSIKAIENSLYIVSIIGNVHKDDIISMNRRIISINSRDEISDLPSCFVEFAQFSSIVTAWCMFSDERLAIVYYCDRDEDETVNPNEDNSDAKKYAYAEISSSLIINISEKSWSEAGSLPQRYEKLDDLWDLIFTKIGNQYDNLDREPIGYSFKLTTYNRAMWGCLMNEVLAVSKRHFDDNLPPYSFYWKTYALKLIFKEFESIQVIGEVITKYTAQAILLLAIDVFIPKRKFMSNFQLINGARLLSRRLIDRYWGISSPVHDAINQFWKEIILEIDIIKHQRDLKLCQLYYFVTFLEDMHKINKREEISHAFSQANFYQKVSGQKKSTTKKLQSLCCICLSTSRTGSGCEDHAICDSCWEFGLLPLIDWDDSQSPDPKQLSNILFLQRAFNVIMRSKLFSCLVCNRPLVKNITKYLLRHEKQAPNLAVYVNSILHDIESTNIRIYNKIRQITYKNTKLHQLGSANSNSRNQIIIERRPIVDRTSATCEIFLGKWNDKQGNKFDCVVKRFGLTEEGYKWILRELSIAVICSGLPCIIDCFGSDLVSLPRNNSSNNNNLPSSCHIAFSLGTKSLADMLKEKISISIHYTLYIMHDIARGLRLLHLLGLTHRDVKPGNVIIFERGENYEAKLIDFGQTRVLNLDKTMQVGTRKYLAPELLFSSNYSQKIDQYSYGVILIELLLHFVNPQYYNDFHNHNDINNHWERFNQFDIGQSLIKIIAQNYWNQLMELIKSLLSSNAADRPSFASCLNLIGEIIKDVCPNQRSDFVYEDEQDFTCELECSQLRLAKSKLSMKEIEVEKRYGDCLFQALEIAGAITVDEEFIKSFIKERKIYFDSEFINFKQQIAEKSLRHCQIIDLFRSQQRANAQYDLKCVAKILNAIVHLYEFIGSVKYGESDPLKSKTIPLYRDNVRNLFLPIVDLINT